MDQMVESPENTTEQNLKINETEFGGFQLEFHDSDFSQERIDFKKYDHFLCVDTEVNVSGLAQAGEIIENMNIPGFLMLAVAAKMAPKSFDNEISRREFIINTLKTTMSLGALSVGAGKTYTAISTSFFRNQELIDTDRFQNEPIEDPTFMKKQYNNAKLSELNLLATDFTRTIKARIEAYKLIFAVQSINYSKQQKTFNTSLSDPNKSLEEKGSNRMQVYSRDWAKVATIVNQVRKKSEKSGEDPLEIIRQEVIDSYQFLEGTQPAGFGVIDYLIHTEDGALHQAELTSHFLTEIARLSAQKAKKEPSQDWAPGTRSPVREV